MGLIFCKCYKCGCCVTVKSTLGFTWGSLMLVFCKDCKGRKMREDWDSYFLKIAEAVSGRSTCPRASVGVLLVRNKSIVSTGYNGVPSGETLNV